MKLLIKVYDHEKERYIENDGELLMTAVGFDPRLGFEELAIQSNGTAIVCDRCGSFEHLDNDRFEVSVELLYYEGMRK